MEKTKRYLHRLAGWTAVLVLSLVLLLALPTEARAETHDLYISANAHFTVSVGDTLNMTTLYTDTNDFDWFIGDNEEKALELVGSRNGSKATFQAVAPGVVTVNCVRTVKTTVSKPYAYYNPLTGKTETRYNVVTESTSYDCICIITIEDNLAPEITKQPAGMAAGRRQPGSDAPPTRCSATQGRGRLPSGFQAGRIQRLHVDL